MKDGLRENSMAMNLERRIAKLQSILDVAKAMTAQRHLDRLLELILTEAAKVVEADRCSLFLVDRERGELWSKIAQGTGSEIRFPVGVGIAGQVAQTGNLINIQEAYEDPRFNRAVDLATGYRTRTILTVPMKNTEGDVVGVIQALNRRDGVFASEDEELLLAMGGQAAAAIENAILHEDIQRLFERFVQASVVAIEARDPTTAGHSERVAKLTVGLAQMLEKAPPPNSPYLGVRFKPDELKQMRYAALLHDFGKVGVREHVLVKANKLYPHELDLLKARFDLIRSKLEIDKLKAQLGGQSLAPFDSQLAELDGLLDFILTCNRPTVLAEGGFGRLAEIAQRSFTDPRGSAKPFLTASEVACLSIPRGSLSADERREIESHVTHTYNFLSQIAWTRDLRRVPEIAFAHHEKLDGRGYPRSIPAQSICVESRMMTIADIFDALTASDRPYKKAVPTEKALDILRSEANAGQIDPLLLGVFVDSGVYKDVLVRPA
jgi:HD-GYP domain-containing protein (c-di-GMP phosphodiesterase class II)